MCFYTRDLPAGFPPLSFMEAEHYAAHNETSHIKGTKGRNIRLPGQKGIVPDESIPNQPIIGIVEVTVRMEDNDTPSIYQKYFKQTDRRKKPCLQIPHHRLIHHFTRFFHGTADPNSSG